MRTRTIVAVVALLVVAACATPAQPGGPATVELDLFSGLPNPSWTIDAAEVWAIWDGLEPGEPAPYPGVLGYRGTIVVFADGSRMTVTGGVASWDGQARTDTARLLERTLVASGRGTADTGLLDEVLAGLG